MSCQINSEIRFPQAEVVALGGATEATVWSNYYRIGEVSKEWASIPYGKPIQNAKYRILDKAMRLCPVGVTGELYIGGTCLAKGYVSEALTAERFIADPYDKEGGKLYRTGDLVRYVHDGNIEFIGRVDHQVKIRGFRVELGEIEAVLNQHEEVRESIVIAREDATGSKRLAAYVVPKQPEKAIDLKLLRHYVREHVPEYMVPSSITNMDKLPITDNGKLDRKRLPEPEEDHAIAAGYTAPRTEVEQSLCEIWSEVLNREKVGIYDNFFEIGGHSLLAAQLQSRIKECFDMNITIKDLFDHPTVIEIANAIEHIVINDSKQLLIREGLRGKRSVHAKSPLIQRRSIQEAELSFAQERIHFGHMMGLAGTIYNIPGNYLKRSPRRKSMVPKPEYNHTASRGTTHRISRERRSGSTGHCS